MEFYSHFERVADPPNFLRKLALKLVETCRLLSSDNRPIGLRIYSKYGKIPMLRLWFFIYFLSYTKSLQLANYKFKLFFNIKFFILEIDFISDREIIFICADLDISVTSHTCSSWDQFTKD